MTKKMSSEILLDEMWKILENLRVPKILFEKGVIFSDGVWTSSGVERRGLAARGDTG